MNSAAAPLSWLARLPRAAWRTSPLGPAARIAWGLVSLTVGLLLLVEVFVGFPPERQLVAKREREVLSAELAWRVATAIDGQGAEVAAMSQIWREARERNTSLLSMQLRTNSGAVTATSGDHTRSWQLRADERSTLENIRVPLRSRGQPWGELQLAYKSIWPDTLAGWLRDAALQRLLLMSVLGVVVFWLYLRRMLRHLDPNAAVPERVRDAFNTLAEGVLVLDASAQVVLANDAFCALHGDDPKTLTGLTVTRLAWLKHALGDRKPWAQVMSTRDNITGMNLSVSTPQGSRELVVNCAPILDGRRLRGCLMSFSDVTDLHERTERLRVALQDLHRSQEEVQQKNAELSLLANRDALTGINNRRALMDQAQQAFERARATGEALACIMCDIDHFKLVNDRYGHAGGDQVIQGAARLLQQGLRVTDVVGRYGGEEFCIMLPTSHSATAADMANAIRAQIEATLGSALTEHPGVQVTMSFGVAELMPGVDHPGALIDRADQALYHAKKTGRNRVSTWPVPAVE